MEVWDVQHENPKMAQKFLFNLESGGFGFGILGLGGSWILGETPKQHPFS